MYYHKPDYYNMHSHYYYRCSLCILKYSHNYKLFYYNRHLLIYIALSYPFMSLQHPVTGPAAQVPDPDRVILCPGGQATVRQHDQGEPILQYRVEAKKNNNNNNNIYINRIIYCIKLYYIYIIRLYFYPTYIQSLL